MPARLVSGEGIVSRYSGYSALGKKCLIVSGKNLYKHSSVFADLRTGLTSCGVGYKTFFEVENNPSYETVLRAVEAFGECGADFIVGVGGGSSMDAAKATALLCANPQVKRSDLFKADAFVNKPVPLLLIGTTAGTGSEVTSASVLTFDTPDGIVKKTVKSAESYATCVLCDSVYTETLPERTTVATALDAICHAIEAYYSGKVGAFGRMYSRKALSVIVPALAEFAENGSSKEVREALYVGSLYAGCAINDGGTSFAHSLGYQLTNYLGYEHGFACAAFMPAFLGKACDADGLAVYADMNAAQLTEFIRGLFKKYIPETDMSGADAEKFARTGMTMPSLNNHIFEPLDFDGCVRLYKNI